MASGCIFPVFLIASMKLLQFRQVAGLMHRLPPLLQQQHRAGVWRQVQPERGRLRAGDKGREEGGRRRLHLHRQEQGGREGPRSQPQCLW